MNRFHFSIITPEGTVLDDNVEEVIFPGTEGFFGVMANHAPMVASTKPGILKIYKKPAVSYYAIDSSLLEVTTEKVTLLSGQAIHAETEKAAHEEVKRFP